MDSATFNRVIFDGVVKLLRDRCISFEPEVIMCRSSMSGLLWRRGVGAGEVAPGIYQRWRAGRYIFLRPR